MNPLFICYFSSPMETPPPKSEWQQLLNILAEKFGMEPDMQSVLFLIGVQELGMGYKKFKKDEKINVLHIAICTVLEPYGYY